MGILIDTELRIGAIATPPALLTGFDKVRLDTSIRGCAVDLHIGSVYRPGAKDGEPGSASKPFALSVVLNEGETALVQTLESFKLDAQHAAFVFPASSVSIQGLLMTNPGHVDPGYEGPVHVTVINMGREPYALQPKDRLLRGLIYKLDSPVASPKVGGVARALVTQELLNKLSPDFLSVSQRTATAAKKEIDASVKRSTFLQYVVPALATFVGVALTSTLTTCTSTARFDERIKSLEDAKAVDRLKTLELNYPTERRLVEIENQLRRIQPAPIPATPTK